MAPLYEHPVSNVPLEVHPAPSFGGRHPLGGIQPPGFRASWNGVPSGDVVPVSDPHGGV